MTLLLFLLLLLMLGSYIDLIVLPRHNTSLILNCISFNICILYSNGVSWTLLIDIYGYSVNILLQ